MTITVNIKPEVQAELARQAASQGSAIETYAATLLEEAARLTRPPKPPQEKSLREVFECVRGLADDIEFKRNPSTGRPVDLS
ncbi:MAG: hypothetical protein JWP63_3269 [Candidatus Solibacter sp.]|nr:hypothetical protein [Candidatus Solibacter sp.]